MVSWCLGGVLVDLVSVVVVVMVVVLSVVVVAAVVAGGRLCMMASFGRRMGSNMNTLRGQSYTFGRTSMFEVRLF